MQLKSLFLSIPRDTIKTLTHYHILSRNTLIWYDLIKFFDEIDLSEQAHKQPLKQMEKYTLTANQFNLSEEQIRKIIARLNQYI